MPNLSTRHPRVYERSRRALCEDLDSCQALQADYLVIHPGAYSDGKTVKDGIDRMAEGLKEALATSSGTMVLIENMAGGSRRLGSTFEELSQMLQSVHQPQRMGICLDTAHLWGAGYPFRTVEDAQKTLEYFDRIVGLSNIHVIHLNDSSAAFGNHRDLHEHIGKGKISLDAFRYLLNHPRLQHCAAILETPRDTPTADVDNLTAVRNLSAGRP